jgi:hypothetical protein
MYPELITCPDIKVFLSPSAVSPFTSASPFLQNIFSSNFTPLSVGNPAYMYDETKELTLRVHDECADQLSLACFRVDIFFFRQWLGRLWF